MVSKATKTRVLSLTLAFATVASAIGGYAKDAMAETAPKTSKLDSCIEQVVRDSAPQGSAIKEVSGGFSWESSGTPVPDVPGAVWREHGVSVSRTQLEGGRPVIEVASYESGYKAVGAAAESPDEAVRHSVFLDAKDGSLARGMQVERGSKVMDQDALRTNQTVKNIATSIRECMSSGLKSGPR